MKTLFRTLALLVATTFANVTLAAEPIDLWFSPGWKAKAAKAKVITTALSEKSGLQIRPRIANSYPQILDTFATGEPALVYVGSFVQAVIRARDLGEGLVQAANGKEYYSGVLVYPQGQDPAAILTSSPTKIAYAVGASSGESSAKAATDGQAGHPDQEPRRHLRRGKGRQGQGRRGQELVVGRQRQALSRNLPCTRFRASRKPRNPDNVLSASKGVSAEVKAKITAAAKASKDVFGATEWWTSIRQPSISAWR